MPRMIDLIRQSAVPANVMRSAARGALSLPTGEMIEILVHLTTNPIFAEQAKMTLAGWDERSSIAAAGDPSTPWEVLNYMVSPENLRPKLLPALLENKSIRESVLIEMAEHATREIVEAMLRSERVKRSAHILHALLTNANLKESETQQAHDALRALGEETTKIMAYKEADSEEKSQYEIEHAAEIDTAEAENAPFELFGQDEELEDLDQLEEVLPAGEPAPESTGGDAAAAPEFQVQAEAETVSPERSSENPAAVALEKFAETGNEAETMAAPAKEGATEGDLERLTKIRDAQGKSRERLTSFQKIARRVDAVTQLPRSK